MDRLRLILIIFFVADMISCCHLFFVIAIIYCVSYLVRTYKKCKYELIEDVIIKTINNEK